MNQETARQDFIDNVLINAKLTKLNTNDDWCNAAHFQNDFDKWTSGNKEIDYFIQNTQIHAWEHDLVLEWYPWENFSDIEEIGKGGYGTVFRAKRKLGRIYEWDHHKNEWSRRYFDQYSALKTIGDSKLNEFLNEVTNLRLLY